MTTKKTVKKTATKAKSTNETRTYKQELSDLIELNEAFVREIDNIMISKLPSAQVGKVLADVVTGLSSQVAQIKQKI